MLHVDLNNIVSEQEAIAQLPDLLKRADENNELIVITRNGRPAVALLGVQQLEELSGHEVHTAEADEAASPGMPGLTPAPAPVVTPQLQPEAPQVAPLVQPSAPAPTQPVTGDLPPLQPANPTALPDMPDLV